MLLKNFGVLRSLVAIFALGFVFGHPAFAEGDEDESIDVRRWQEKTVDLPAAPVAENLLPFYVSAATNNDFFVDGSSISVGADGVVRYVLVVQSASGARNVSFEGIRCETKEYRDYAFGRPDGTWSKSRNENWRKIRDVPANRQHFTLFIDYFCPGGVIALSVDHVRANLRRGPYRDNRWW